MRRGGMERFSGLGLILFLRITLFHTFRWLDIKFLPAILSELFVFRFYYLIHFPNVLHFHLVNRSPPAGDCVAHFLIYCLGLCLYCVSKSELSQVAASFGQAGSSARKNGPKLAHKNRAWGLGVPST